MKKFGLIGYPLSNSFSENYFKKKLASFNHKLSYKNIPLQSLNDIKKKIKTEQFSGFNVTIPFKEQIMPYLDKIDENAQIVGAVNCVNIEKNQWIGYNTDVYGFEISLTKILNPHITYQALLLGDGGAAKAVKFVLKKLNIPFLSVNRTIKPSCITFEELNENHISNSNLIINTTPLGMSPLEELYPPLPYSFITRDHIAYDLIYHPEKTLFLSLCEKQGAKVKNGFEMLELQAEKSYQIWGIQ